MKLKTGGVTGSNIPNRVEDLSRERDANRNGRTPVTKGTLRETQRPRMNPKWHPIAKMMWTAGLTSGMEDFYQNSDLAYLYSICDDLSTAKFGAAKYGKVNANALAIIYTAFGNLGFSEGTRRQMRIELDKPEVESKDEAEAAIGEYKAMLKVVS